MNFNDWKKSEPGEHEGGHDGFGGAADAPAAPPRELSKSMLGVVGAFAIAMAAIWGIGRQAGPATAQAAPIDSKAQAAIDSVLTNAGKASAADSRRATEKLLTNFYGTPGALSTPMEQLAGNPFVHGEPTQPAVIQTAAVVPAATAIDPDNAHLRRLAETFKTLRLQTVLVSRRSSFAMINDKLLAVGNHVGEFVLTQISADSVVLTAGGRQFALPLATAGDR
jgi:hypothetical protein